ncbi:MAG: hypothetical protein PHQ40_09100 [Anaerolineaceae bacterium]|nr:hypothetical protein [Anaerolineaceae bacterium]
MKKRLFLNDLPIVTFGLLTGLFYGVVFTAQVLGMAGWYRPAVLVGTVTLVAATLAAWGYFRAGASQQQFFPALQREAEGSSIWNLALLAAGLAILVLLILIPLIRWPLTPVNETLHWDAAAYHFPKAIELYRTGSAWPLTIAYAEYPYGYESLLSFVLTLTGSTALFGTVHAFISLYLFLTLWLLGRRYTRLPDGLLVFLVSLLLFSGRMLKGGNPFWIFNDLVYMIGKNDLLLGTILLGMVLHAPVGPRANQRQFHLVGLALLTMLAFSIKPNSVYVAAPLWAMVIFQACLPSPTVETPRWGVSPTVETPRWGTSPTVETPRWGVSGREDSSPGGRRPSGASLQRAGDTTGAGARWWRRAQGTHPSARRPSLRRPNGASLLLGTVGLILPGGLWALRNLAVMGRIFAQSTYQMQQWSIANNLGNPAFYTAIPKNLLFVIGIGLVCLVGAIVWRKPSRSQAFALAALFAGFILTPESAYFGGDPNQAVTNIAWRFGIALLGYVFILLVVLAERPTWWALNLGGKLHPLRLALAIGVVAFSAWTVYTNRGLMVASPGNRIVIEDQFRDPVGSGGYHSAYDYVDKNIQNAAVHVENGLPYYLYGPGFTNRPNHMLVLSNGMTTGQEVPPQYYVIFRTVWWGGGEGSYPESLATPAWQQKWRLIYEDSQGRVYQRTTP